MILYIATLYAPFDLLYHICNKCQYSNDIFFQTYSNLCIMYIEEDPKKHPPTSKNCVGG